MARGELKPCGTAAAGRRHLRRGEPVCPACRAAFRREKADARRRAGKPERWSLGEVREIRNGLPWKPYRYRGTGEDVLTAWMDGAA
jgi:hypothetical protein